ncbi:hypothetical protein FZW96_00605 [Bacillus sp. BGMRC 2118]|nr:hypothetical protein FZW96_00605 [Bacillus sp. BGMRC 2118]
MVYIAKTERIILTFLLALNLTSLLVAKSYESFTLQALLILLCFFAIFTSYKVSIDDDITYEVYVVGFRIYKKKISPANIKHITFKRVGWTQKGALVVVSGGLNVRLYHFNPKSIDSALQQFANFHHIDIKKTKDYKILEQ